MDLVIFYSISHLLGLIGPLNWLNPGFFRLCVIVIEAHQMFSHCAGKIFHISISHSEPRNGRSGRQPYAGSVRMDPWHTVNAYWAVQYYKKTAFYICSLPICITTCMKSHSNLFSFIEALWFVFWPEILF